MALKLMAIGITLIMSTMIMIIAAAIVILTYDFGRVCSYMFYFSFWFVANPRLAHSDPPPPPPNPSTFCPIVRYYARRSQASSTSFALPSSGPFRLSLCDWYQTRLLFCRQSAASCARNSRARLRIRPPAPEFLVGQPPSGQQPAALLRLTLALAGLSKYFPSRPLHKATNSLNNILRKLPVTLTRCTQCHRASTALSYSL
jgi:hypothetical protein